MHLNDSVLLASGLLAHRHGAQVVWHLRSSLANGGRDRRSRLVARALDAWGDAAIAIDEDVARTFPLRLPVEIVPNAVVAEAGEAADLPRARRTRHGRLLRLPPPAEGVAAARRGDADPRRRGSARARGRRRRRRPPVGGVRRHPRPAAEAARGSRRGARPAAPASPSSGSTDRFSFLPFTTQPGPVYRALDVVVFPNQGAGLGRPVLEAAAYGKPVVASGSPDGAGPDRRQRDRDPARAGHAGSARRGDRPPRPRSRAPSGAGRARR